jgi:hypothetical protein
LPSSFQSIEAILFAPPPNMFAVTPSDRV